MLTPLCMDPQTNVFGCDIDELKFLLEKGEALIKEYRSLALIEYNGDNGFTDTVPIAIKMGELKKEIDELETCVERLGERIGIETDQ